MSKTMLVNVIEPEEVRVAVMEGNRLEELYIERASRSQIVGNIYKAKVVNVERSLDAAFVDFGGRRNGFLHISDVAPSYLPHKKGGRHASVNGAVKRGQELMVQVTREGIGKKAPRVTSYVSLPGRYLVLMPEIKRHGVSRKISDEGTRQKLREMLETLGPPPDMGFIVRTAGEGRNKRDLQRDLNYLLRLWRVVQRRFKDGKGPALLYEESDLLKRTIRDTYSTDIEEVLIDSEEEYRKVTEFMKLTMPRQRKKVKLYSDPEPLFHRHKLEDEIEKIHRHEVKLPHGGSIVIEQTEALVAIDVNSGKYVKESNVEETAYRTNLEAAPEIARQIRLRDLGGVMVIDFIDMEKEKHRRDVEQSLWNALRRDRARLKMLRMSKFGIVEMTRQRMRENIHSTLYQTCPYCAGTGRIKSAESVGLDAFRNIRSSLKHKRASSISVSLSPAVADYLQNEKRTHLASIEAESNVRLEIRAVPDMNVESVQIQMYDKDGQELKT